MSTLTASPKKIEGWGSQDSLIWVVAFCPHSSDYSFGRILTNSFGQHASRLFTQAGMDWKSLRKDTLIPWIPKMDKSDSWHVPAKEVPADLKGLLKISKSKYLTPRLLPALAEFQQRLVESKPHLIFALGAEATALLTGSTSFMDVRGTILPCVLEDSVKVLPIFNPSILFKQVSMEAIFNADLRKGKIEAGFRGIVRTRREVYIPELVEELHDWWKENVTDSLEKISVDIETIPTHKIITCVGIATSPTKSLVIPLYCKQKEGGSYWTHSEELYIHRFIRAALAHPRLDKIAHNGSYDFQWVYEQLHIPTLNYNRDTMLMHHSLYPEMKKSLGFLSSIYTTEPAWKGMVKFTGKAGEKADG